MYNPDIFTTTGGSMYYDPNASINNVFANVAGLTQGSLRCFSSRCGLFVTLIWNHLDRLDGRFPAVAWAGVSAIGADKFSGFALARLISPLLVPM